MECSIHQDGGVVMKGPVLWGKHNQRHLWIVSSPMNEAGDAASAASAVAVEDGNIISTANRGGGKGVMVLSIRHHERRRSEEGMTQKCSDEPSFDPDHELPLHSTEIHPHSLSLHSDSLRTSTAINNWHPPQHHPNRRLFQRNHESFLEDMARRECQSVNDADNRNNALEIDEDGRIEERRRFMLLDFESDDDTSDSDEESSTDDEEGDDDDLTEQGNVNGGDMDDDDGEEEGGPDDQDLDVEPDHNQLVVVNGTVNERDDENLEQKKASSLIVQHMLPAALPIAFNMPTMKESQSTNMNTQRMSSLLRSLANSEEQPLIRADIPWSVIISCGSPLLHSTQKHSHLKPFGSEAQAPSHLQPKPSLLRTLYQQLRDPNGGRLLQGVLRMDPPLEAVKVLLDSFPLACLDMEGFFTACQFAHPNTSSCMMEYRQGNVDRGCDFAKESHNNIQLSAESNSTTNESGYDSEHENDDVGEVVKLVMHQTIRARRLNSIDWGMVAFLGDARISPSHAKLLLRHAPEALIDSKHGAFGVSPLDRMASGFFIHGETNAWVEKLRLALRVAAYVRRQKQLEEKDGKSSLSTKISLPKGFFSLGCKLLRRRESLFDNESCDFQSHCRAQSFYPYHELIRLLVSPNFQGNKFGQHGFLQTLRACTQSDPDAFLRPDNEGNLPIHVALRSECETVLGLKGERRLIKYLLDLDQNAALCPEGSAGCKGKRRRLPLRMSIENAWPVYDLIIKSALACCGGSPNSMPMKSECKEDPSETSVYKGGSLDSSGDFIVANMIFDQPLLHDALNGPYHSRFGIHGARQLVKNIISKITHYRYEQQNQSDNKSQCILTNFVDTNGRTALHIALESKWPVHDLIVQASPNFCLEARDPTRHGFFPFQIAACAFTASYTNERGKQQSPPVLSGSNEDNRSIFSGVSNVVKAAGDEKVASLVEMSMLFELIRESPLCVTWSMSYEDNQSNARHRVHTLKGFDGRSSAIDAKRFMRRSKKRRQP